MSPTIHDPAPIVARPAVTSERQQRPVTILRPKHLKAAVGLSIPTIYRMIKRGEFPRPKKLGLQAVGWSSEVVADWLASRPTTTDSHSASVIAR